MLANEFTEVFREEHRQMRDMLLGLMDAMEANDVEAVRQGIDEMAEHAAWSTSRKVIVLGAVVIMAGAAGWWLWKRHKTRKAAKPERVAKVPSMPRARTTTGLAGSLPRPWAI